MMRALSQVALCTALCVSVIACGGGGGRSIANGSGSGSTTAAAANVASVIVDGGPSNDTVNTLYTSVTVCTPGSTTNCQTIDHIQVDTGSVGLRILASVLTLSLPLQAAGDGSPLVECTVFADGYSWGPVATADFQIAGETASSLPLQIIGDSRFPNVPANCSSAGPTAEDTVDAFGANGILGIGVLVQDCGSGCETAGEVEAYYSCPAACQPTTVPLTAQVSNPISMFAADNNGSIIDLPSVAAQGAATVTGSLIFGVDTQTNNASGSETVLTVDPDSGDLTMAFDGQTLNQSFIDSGSNGIYFADTSLPICTQSGLADFYCPAATEALTVTVEGANGVTAAVDFSVANAQTLGSDNPTFSVLPALAGTNPVSDSFDLGLPFFYGRRVATVVEAQMTNVGTGPYIAF